MVGVLGLSESSRADLNDQLDALGTNLLVVSPGQDMMGEDATPARQVGRHDRPGARPSRPPPRRTPSTPRSARPTGCPTSRPAASRWPRPAPAWPRRSPPSCARVVGSTRPPEKYPAVVLGSTAARRLAVGSLDAGGAGLARRPVVRRGRDPRTRRPGSRARRDRADRPVGRRRSCSATTCLRPPSTPASTPTRSPRPGTCSAGRPTRRRPPRCRCRAPPTPSRPRPPPTSP